MQAHTYFTRLNLGPTTAGIEMNTKHAAFGEKELPSMYSKEQDELITYKAQKKEAGAILFFALSLSLSPSLPLSLSLSLSLSLARSLALLTSAKRRKIMAYWMMRLMRLWRAG